MKIKAKCQTWLKKYPIDSTKLPPTELIKAVSAKELVVQNPVAVGKHTKVEFNPPLTITLSGVSAKWGEGFLFTAHWEGLEDAPAITTKTAIDWSQCYTWQDFDKHYQEFIGRGSKQSPVATGTIDILENTWLKATTAAASSLGAESKRPLSKGEVLLCQVIGAKDNHGQVKTPDGKVWFIFNAHFKGQETASGQNAVGRSNAPVAPDKLKAALLKLKNPNVPEPEVDDLVKAFSENAAKYSITKREHAIHFFAQCLHESGGLMYLEELASGADYDDRDDLGNCSPEAIEAAKKAGTTPGRFYKGHSLIQTTGYDNHRKFGEFAGIDAVNDPAALARYPHALNAAMFFWMSQGPSLSEDVDKGGLTEACCKAIGRIVNGGSNGESDRLWYFRELCRLI